MSQNSSKKITYFLIIFTILAQGFNAFFLTKPLWLDEYFVVANIKLKAFPELFGILLKQQAFPRIYLCIIKWFSHLNHYSLHSLRLLPYLFSVASLFLLSRIIPHLFNKKAFFYTFLFLLLLTNSNTFLYYFAQVKPYSADIFGATLALWQFLSISKETFRFSSKAYWLSLAGFMIMPFFSLTYPIVAAPIIGILFLELLFFKTHKSVHSKETLLIIIGFIIAIIAVYFINIRLTLSNGDVHHYFRKYIVNYSSWHAFINHLLRSIAYFFTTFTGPTSNQGHAALTIPLLAYQIVIGIFTCVGMLFIFYTQVSSYKKHRLAYFWKITTSDINAYFLLLFLTIWGLYFIGELPIVGNRINFFMVPMLIFFLIHGIELCSNYLKQHQLIKISKLLIYGFTMIMLMYFCSRYTQVLTSKTNWYSTKRYNNISKAVQTANRLKNPVIISSMAAVGYGGSLPQWVVISNPNYLMNRQIPVEILNTNHTFSNICKKYKNQKKNFIIIRKNSYQVISQKSLCNS